MSKVDPIFGLSRPLIFAHRGGAGEAPESTIEGFLHGLNNGADVLEVDVQLTLDGKLVIWHGPGLEIAFEKTDDSKYIFWENKDIGDFKWEQLRKLWVSKPAPLKSNLNWWEQLKLWLSKLTRKISNQERQTKCVESRRLMRLHEFLEFVFAVKQGDYGKDLSKKPFHLNFELKKNDGKAPKWNQKEEESGHFPYLQKLLTILNEKKHPDIMIVVASMDHEIISDFRKIQNGAYMTNISLKEHWPYYDLFDPLHIKVIGWFFDKFVDEFSGDKFKKLDDLSKNAFQTAGALVTEELVREVHDREGGIYAFLTEFFGIPELEPKGGPGVGSEKYARDLSELLNKNIDGVMTDYPSVVYQILKKLGLRI